ncbi:MAG: DUF11 domain-containing protein [Oscillospiraceae bacterium]|nr:DUF11 domain-containing protein [Oscillospiraceae bacterium]
MALFTNYATLSYNGQTLNSNTVTGEILETLDIDKTVLQDSYATGEDLVYVVSLSNSGDTELANLTVTDNLGAYEYNGNTVYPLAYQDGTLRYFVDGDLQPAPTVTAGPPLAISGLSIPAGGNIVLVYQASATDYAPLGQNGEIVNTVTVTGPGVTGDVTASATVGAAQTARLNIAKSVSPGAVAPGGTLTYTFVMENTGPVEAAGVVMADTFDPILADLKVSYNGTTWARATNFTYDDATGAFSTMPDQITIPAATYTQAADGSWATTPGTATLVISGTVQTA